MRGIFGSNTLGSPFYFYTIHMSLITPIFTTTPLLRVDTGLSKVFHDTSLFGDGTQARPLRVLTHPLIKSGTGTPEAAVTAPIGTLYLRTDGGANTTLYVKESGTGNTGWVAK